MENDMECPVCHHEAERRWKKREENTHDVLTVECQRCGSFHLSAPFLSQKDGWLSVPADQQRKIAQFLHTTKEKRQELRVGLPILGIVPWQRYIYEGETCIRIVEHQRKKGELAQVPTHS